MEKVLPVHLVSPLRSIDAYANMKITEKHARTFYEYGLWLTGKRMKT